MQVYAYLCLHGRLAQPSVHFIFYALIQAHFECIYVHRYYVEPHTLLQNVGSASYIVSYWHKHLIQYQEYNIIERKLLYNIIMLLTILKYLLCT